LIVELNASANMFSPLKNLLYFNFVILKLKCINLIFNEILSLYASFVCLLHSRFIENRHIWILEDGPLISDVVLSHQAPLAEMQAQERVSRVEAENATMLASSRMSLQRCARLKRWPRRNLVACQMRRSMPSVDGGVREGVLGAPRGAHPSADPGLRAVSCHCRSSTSEESPIRGGCESLPSSTPRWPKSLPCFGW
jgi:hypothetical protein